MVVQVVLDVEAEPQHKKVREYASFLGMNLEEDEGFLWIAEQGLCEPLAAPWTAWLTEEDGDQIFYFNAETGASIWEHPADEKCRALYAAAKANRDFAVLVVTISGALSENRMVTVTCTNSLSGKDVARMNVTGIVSVFVFKRLLAKELGILTTHLRLMLTSGCLLDDDRRPLCRIFGLDLGAVRSKIPGKAGYTARSGKIHGQGRQVSSRKPPASAEMAEASSQPAKTPCDDLTHFADRRRCSAFKRDFISFRCRTSTGKGLAIKSRVSFDATSPEGEPLEDFLLQECTARRNILDRSSARAINSLNLV